MTCGAFVTLPREEDVAELATSLAVGGKLLQRPAVPVGVGEEDELPPGVLLDATRLDPASRELGVRCGGVRYDDLRPRGADRRIGETGGVSCTKRSSGLTVWSWSRLNPTRS